MSEEKGLASPTTLRGLQRGGWAGTDLQRQDFHSNPAGHGAPGLLCSYRPRKPVRLSQHRELPMASDGSGSKLCNAKDEGFFFFTLKGMS